MIAIYPGSFDPFSNGHLNVLTHASAIFEQVYVVIMCHPNKKRFLDPKISVQLIKRIVETRFTNVKVLIGESSLIYKEAERLGCDYVVRGVRNNGLDYNYEENLAEFNKDIGNINTIFIRADVNKNVSSTMIRMLWTNKEDITRFVPKEIYEYLTGGYV